MKRPSRGERWSETTTRQIGFFLLPTRVRRTRTDIERERLATARQLLQRWHLAARDLLHHLAHLAELLHELRHDAGHHLQQRAERAHVAHLLHLLEEVVERELLLADLPLELGRLALVHLLLGLLDERHHVAHAEDPL